MKLTRDDIIEGDFDQAVDGWDRGDVLRHLNEIAEAVEALQRGEPVEREDDDHGGEPQALLNKARKEADAIRAKAAEGAEHQIAQAQLAVKDLLDRVGGLNLAVEEARQAVEERAGEMARRLEESSEPLVSAMRERAESLNAEMELMATGLAASAHAPAAEPEPPPSEPDPEPEVEAEAEPEAEAEVRPKAEAGTGLAAGDLDDAVEQLDTDAAPEAPPADNGADDGASRGLERARLIALNMALGGASQEEAEQRLREDFDIEDPSEILDDAFGPGRDGS